MGDYLAFRRMITPAFIQIIFWIAVVGIVIGGIVEISHKRVGAGLALIILGPLAVRIYAELLIVIFRINDNVFAIRAGKTDDATPPAP
ncbi:MAG: DUF4282 domain-containing protein [Gaiellaceae bacterium]